MSNNNLPPILGNGWEKIFDDGGSVINISINIEKLKSLPTDDYGNVKLVLKKTKEPNIKSKATHILVEDTYQSQKLANNTTLPKIDLPNIPIPF
jgi:hypothetical protein